MTPLFCSVYQKSVLFGGYPSKQMFNELLDHGVSVFVDMTTRYDRYKFRYIYNHPHRVSFPILDNSIPYNKDNFCRFIVYISYIIYYQREKLYIHCKGGHNRSGLVISAILCFLENCIPVEAMKITADLHSARIYLKPKYKNSLCPDNVKQRQFLCNIFQPFVVSQETFADTVRMPLIDLFSMTKIRPLIVSSPPLMSVLVHLRQQLYFEHISSLQVGFSKQLYIKTDKTD
jgi:hypothetical protein